jgi:branched-chain amino acid transport system ATP-binding protein
MLFLPSVRRAEVAHREAVERIVELVELERYRHAAVGSLPFGVQKIVGFARALALEVVERGITVNTVGRPQPRGT